MLYYIETLESYWNNLLIKNFLKLDEIRVSKFHRKIRSPVNRSGIRPLDSRNTYGTLVHSVHRNIVFAVYTVWIQYLTHALES